MDGITEPVVLVLGHPIGGNPAQFALERALESLKLGWRVLSCDVSPERIDDAIAGAEVLGFRGLLLDRNLVTRPGQSESTANRKDPNNSGEPGEPHSLQQQYPADQPKPTAEPPNRTDSQAADSLAAPPKTANSRRPAFDFFCRQPDRTAPLAGQDLLADWLGETIVSFLKKEAIDDPHGLEIGPKDASFPAGVIGSSHHSPIAWAASESIQAADVIVMTTVVDVEAWPKPAGATLVIDLSSGPNDVDVIRSLGYEVIGNEQIRIGTLMECLRRWTGEEPDEDVLIEAIEEYLAV